MSVDRPVLRWHGGKWMLAPWIIENFPPHRIYVEPFGGAASVLMRKDRCYSEVYNDLDKDVVNLFRVLRNRRTAGQLKRMLQLTPFAREEFNEAYDPCDCRVERARRLVVRSFMGHGSDGPTSPYRTGFRSNSNRNGTTPAHDWVNYGAALGQAVARLQGITIECKDGLEVMRQHDTPETLHYVDPPYLHATRTRVARRPGGGSYKHELTDGQHQALLDLLLSLKGMVVLSGYPHALYDERLSGWRRIERQALADGARPRTEVLWINPSAVANMPQKDLFTHT
ncbi:adenine-specific DNA methyltransferase [Caulobacter phage Sansa]|uniref:Adenine-specific DNA methyltransferase n=1 Tax=Caulobacter phage Sansa TaxID=1675600 RepID=A0A0K1LM14_9CAUD|nr:DNA methyltransferase [Caulobacter phage Sansa]AKU43494.1 adenine-specific DNA methyltransferase [Caulobacter phage Sansa]